MIPQTLMLRHDSNFMIKFYKTSNFLNCAWAFIVHLLPCFLHDPKGLYHMEQAVAVYEGIALLEHLNSGGCFTNPAL